MSRETRGVRRATALRMAYELAARRQAGHGRNAAPRRITALTYAAGLAAIAAGAGCSAAPRSPAPGAQSDGIALQMTVQGLDAPVYLTAPAGDSRLFVVEQPGRIRVVKDGRLLPRPFLDLTAKVGYGGERGLFSVAFHPRYAANGRLYVNYTDRRGDTRIERYVADPAADTADPGSATLVLGVGQPYANHNGGHIVFGPDGMLYVAMGDGGSGGDPRGNGQDPGTVLGKLLRLDVDRGEPYRVPPDNPLVGRRGARPEIWALGLRNPWRIAFDRGDGLLYIADVGQNRWEEVNVARTDAKGLNFGWNRMEGLHCYALPLCSQEGLALPVLEYGHGDGCSIIGGYVYRGRALAAALGHYFYSDYCSGWLRSFRYERGAAADQRAWRVQVPGGVLSFGEDAFGELYVLSANGTAYRLVRAAAPGR